MAGMVAAVTDTGRVIQRVITPFFRRGFTVAEGSSSQPRAI
jgi:hypothetical protein